MDDKKKINIELRPEIAKGAYSNLSIITHSPSDFVMDFIVMMPGAPKPEVISRIVMTPENAKRLLKALKDNISTYEVNFGEIKERQGNPPVGSIPFSTGGGEA